MRLNLSNKTIRVRFFRTNDPILQFKPHFRMLHILTTYSLFLAFILWSVQMSFSTALHLVSKLSSNYRQQSNSRVKCILLLFNFRLLMLLNLQYIYCSKLTSFLPQQAPVTMHKVYFFNKRLFTYLYLSKISALHKESCLVWLLDFDCFMYGLRRGNCFRSERQLSGAKHVTVSLDCKVWLQSVV